MRWLTPLSAARDAARFGRKAAELSKLSGSPGIRVPDGFVLDARAFDAVLDAAVPAAQHPAALVRGAARDRGASRLAAIQARVRDAPMPEGLCAEIAAALAERKGRFASIADVRGHGLFVGIEITKADAAKTPDPDKAIEIINRLKDRGFLSSNAGAFRNVVKIRPPLVFARSHAEEFLVAFDATMAELDG